MSAYFDTSALLKLVLDEPGADLAREAWDATPAPVVSQLAYPEACAGLAVARRGGRLARDEAGTREAIDEIYDELEAVDLAEDIARSAARLAETRRLRGADAVHLATALAALEPGGLLVTWDVALGRAARAEGLTVLP